MSLIISISTLSPFYEAKLLLVTDYAQSSKGKHTEIQNTE